MKGLGDKRMVCERKRRDLWVDLGLERQEVEMTRREREKQGKASKVAHGHVFPGGTLSHGLSDPW